MGALSDNNKHHIKEDINIRVHWVRLNYTRSVPKWFWDLKKNTYYAIKRWMISLGEHGYVSYKIRCEFYLLKKIYLLSFNGYFVYVQYIKKLWLLVTFFSLYLYMQYSPEKKIFKKRHITLFFNFCLCLYDSVT